MASLKLCRTFWGVDEALDPEKWDDLFATVKSQGYCAVELITLGWRSETDKLVELLNKHKLGLICQIHTTGGYIEEGKGYIYCSSSEVEDHKTSFEALVKECSQLLRKVNEGGFINSHSGIDYWRTSQAIDFLLFALTVEATYKIKITHETHRQRLFWNPFSTFDILDHAELKGKDLKLNADLSHWCVACERVFDPVNEPRDKWWPEYMALLAQHCHYTHARVGFAQGPQVGDPAAPEVSKQVSLHIAWWQELWRSQKARGLTDCWVNPEFGPAPYLPCVPHTQEPVADLAKVVDAFKRRLQQAYASI